MFQGPKIFSEFSEIISYLWDRTLPMRSKQFHDESSDYSAWVSRLEEDYCVRKAFFLAQCQSSDIVEITKDNLEDILFADACFTRLRNITLNVVVADCCPILLYDTRQKLVWVVHAGWRGTVSNIVSKTLSALQKKYHSLPEDIYLALWPSISQKHYEVWEEVALQFSPESVLRSGERYYLDLRTENLRQALGCWIPIQNIEASGDCTFELQINTFPIDASDQERTSCVG